MTPKLELHGFAARHLGPRERDQLAQLRLLGYESLQELVDAAVPAGVRVSRPLALPGPATEEEVLAKLRQLAGRNKVQVQFLGQGFSPTHTPAVIMRGVLEDPGWYTAYTPYQPEISQGRLEALLNFQTMVSDLTALPVANASMLDEASAAAEAALLMRRANKSASSGAGLVLDQNLFPQTIAVVKGRAEALGFPVIVADLAEGLPDEEAFGVILQQPADSGAVTDPKPVIAEAKARGMLVTVAADILSLTLIEPPGEQGADVAVGNTQRFGVPLFFGGPHAAYFAVRKGLERALPGRLVGVSKDDAGRPAYRLALQTREQHIRREKATSNICTAQALLAVVASMYAVYHGPEGLQAIATEIHRQTRSLAAALTSSGYALTSESFFDTLWVKAPGRAEELVRAAEKEGVNLRLVDQDTVGISVAETTTPADLEKVARVFGAAEPQPAAPGSSIPEDLMRRSSYLDHPIFHTVRSETQMMRYLRRLSDRDLALDRTMIPLGSCTMKLNSAVEMAAISWPEFAALHPFVPEDQAAGWRELIGELEENLAEITGYAAVSVQPNSGAQGEYAGLLAIRDYHAHRGDHQRDVCLIPASAHGTNAASAALAGMRVVVLKTGANGEIDLADLDQKISDHGARVAAIMLTYPSTYGVYDEEVVEVADRVHAAGGQVYVDGANMNALVGIGRPGDFGGDVSHLNLHKTFAIPHGGGGPGVGPVAVAAHLAPYLPGDPTADGGGGSPVAGTLFGSAGVLPISYAYISLLGGPGLTKASQVAILNANYLAKRLESQFPVLYQGSSGLVAHECIFDLRPLTAETGITAEDVAKRLIDFGFHAPTLAFPVPGTLMVEPTESEDVAELDRFVEAMTIIREEINQVQNGEVSAAESPLRRAPHTAAAVASTEWDRPYTREKGAFPVTSLQTDKYFPPVGRIDGAYGDRNLMCTCPAPTAFAE